MFYLLHVIELMSKINNECCRSVTGQFATVKLVFIRRYSLLLVKLNRVIKLCITAESRLVLDIAKMM